MRFMILIRADKDTEVGVVPSEQLPGNALPGEERARLAVQMAENAKR